MPSNIDDVIDSVEDTADDLQQKTKKAAIDSTSRVKEDARDNLRQDAGWTGRTSMALNTSFEQFKRGKFQTAAWVNRNTAPYARVAEMGSGDKTLEEWEGSKPAAKPDNMPAGFPYDEPDFSEELVDSLQDWVETKPIITDEEPRQLAIALALQISGNIPDEEDGTFAHPFMRPAWQENVELIKSDFEYAVRSAFK